LATGRARGFGQPERRVAVAGAHFHDAAGSQRPHEQIQEGAGVVGDVEALFGARRGAFVVLCTDMLEFRQQGG
jgi:hypothetical protein